MRPLLVPFVLAGALAAGCNRPNPVGPPDTPAPRETLPAPALNPPDSAMADTTAAEAEVEGTVRRVDLEGGGWVIETANGTFQPTNLAADYQDDGLRVLVALRPRPDMLSTLQVGQIADVVTIRRR